MIVALLATWVVVGTHPRLEGRGVSWWAGSFAEQDEGFFGEQRLIAPDAGVDGADVEVLVRNPAPYPVTVVGVDDVSQRITLVRSEMPGALDDSGRRPDGVGTLRVAAGESFVVRATILLPCAEMSPMSSIGNDSARVTVLSLGPSGTVVVPLGGLFTVSTTEQWLPPAGCTPGEVR